MSNICKVVDCDTKSIKANDGFCRKCVVKFANLKHNEIQEDIAKQKLAEKEKNETMITRYKDSNGEIHTVQGELIDDEKRIIYTGTDNGKDNKDYGTIYDPYGNEDVFPYDRKYHGELLNNKRDGQGIAWQQQQNGYIGMTYKGEFKNDKYSGEGNLSSINQTWKGTFLDGEFVQGVHKYEVQPDFDIQRLRLDTGYEELSTIIEEGTFKNLKMEGECSRMIYKGTGNFTEFVDHKYPWVFKITGKCKSGRLNDTGEILAKNDALKNYVAFKGEFKDNYIYKGKVFCYEKGIHYKRYDGIFRIDKVDYFTILGVFLEGEIFCDPVGMKKLKNRIIFKGKCVDHCYQGISYIEEILKKRSILERPVSKGNYVISGNKITHKNGLLIKFNNNGRVVEQSQWKNYKLHGYKNVYDNEDQGHLLERSEWTDGERHGTTTLYHPRTLATLSHPIYQDLGPSKFYGDLDGVSGTLKKATEWVGGKKHGVSNEYTTDLSPMSRRQPYYLSKEWVDTYVFGCDDCLTIEATLFCYGKEVPIRKTSDEVDYKCCVCYEEKIEHSPCGHQLCSVCFDQISKKDVVIGHQTRLEPHKRCPQCQIYVKFIIA
jgi:hypothetical protein